MLTLSRRFLVLATLLFWQGGFLFYAAVVVPVGQRDLGHTRQGFITRQVTNYLNASGAIALAPLAWDIAVTEDRSRRRYRCRWLCWLGLTLALVMLAWLHLRMDESLDAENLVILDSAGFRPQHRLYLWTSTVQWGLSLIYALLTLQAWQAEDSRRRS